MPFLTQDILEISVKQTGVVIGDLRTTIDSLWGTTRDGTQIELYNSQENLPTGAVPGSGAYILGSAVNVQGSLYFAIGYTFGRGLPVEFATEVFRMTQDGTVESVAYLANSSPAGFGFEDDPLDIASEHNGQYILNTSDFALWDPVTRLAPHQTYSIAADGSVTQLSDFVRLDRAYFGAYAGLASVGETLFVIGDEQTPDSETELYRIGADGNQSLVSFKQGFGVIDVESFAGKAWFVQMDTNPGDTIGTLWTIGETGAAQKIAVGGQRDALFLDTDAGGLVMIHQSADQRQAGIDRVAADGTLTSVLNDASIFRIFDVVGFAGRTYFTGSGPDALGINLYQVTADGRAELVIDLLDGDFSLQLVDGLTVVGDKLWFSALKLVSDGFGGQVPRHAYFSLDDQNTVQVVSGVPGRYPDLEQRETIDFSIDVPDPVLGTADPDALRGTVGGELLSGLAGNDTLVALGGNDMVLGGAGNDLASGNDGNDSLVGGDGADTLNGSEGNDNLNGGAGNDSLRGGGGADSLEGGTGNDLVLGESGADFLRGGIGNDTMTGGLNADQFNFFDGDRIDTITDFQNNIDTVLLESDLWLGSLSVRAVVNTFGALSGNVAVLDFGTDKLSIAGVSALSQLYDDIVIL